MSDLYTDDDVERGAEAMGRHYAAAPFLTSDLTTTKAVLDAVLPAYRTRLLNDLADDAYNDHALTNMDADSIAADWLRAKADEVEPVGYHPDSIGVLGDE